MESGRSDNGEIGRILGSAQDSPRAVEGVATGGPGDHFCPGSGDRELETPGVRSGIEVEQDGAEFESASGFGPSPQPAEAATATGLRSQPGWSAGTSPAGAGAGSSGAMFGDHPAASDRVPARNAARRPGSGPQSPPRSRCSLFAVPHCLIRAAEVAKELLGDGFSGVVITDRPAVDNCFHLRQLCWAHLLRDFQGRIAAGGEGERIGAQLLALGKKVFPHWPRARDGTVTRRMMKAHLLDLAGDLREVFGAGLAAPHGRTVTLCGSRLDRDDPIGPCVSHDGVG